MIIAPTPAFYMVRASGEAAELIASVFSPGTMGDITDVMVLSKQYNNDIEPMNELDESLETIKSGLGVPIIEEAEFNPLFIPMPIDALDDALEVEGKSELVRFSAMRGNPFVLKSVELKTNDEPILTATVSYQQFDLPGYEVIMEGQQRPLN